jgi:hypothetical protein
VLAVATTAGTAVSQDLQFGVHGGAAIPVSTFYTLPATLNTGTALGVVMNLNSTHRPLGVAISLNYSSMRADLDSIGYAENWSVTGALVWWPGAIAGRLTPFVTAGVGADFWQIQPINGIAAGLAAGAGAIYQLGTWSPYAEGRFHLTLVDGSNLRQLLVLAGVRYRL